MRLLIKSYQVILLILITLMVSVIWSCNKDELDDEMPQIKMNGADHYPQACDTVYVGETFVFNATFTDNVELGAYSLDIHHNFDHHSHSTELVECPLDPVKQAVNPLLLIRQYDIPSGLKNFEAEAEIFVPENVDIGDYHFMVRLTDKTGWQDIRGISFKIWERE
jgi:hypothetical protein